MSDIFEGMFGGAGRGGGGGFSGGFGGFGRGRSAPKGANSAYALRVPFVDAATLSPQRITLADGKAIDLKLPAGVESGTQMRLGGKGEPVPGARRRDHHDRGRAPCLLHPRRRRCPPRPADQSDRSGARRPGQGPHRRAPRHADHPQGYDNRQDARLKGKGFHKKDGGRGDQLITLMIDIPADDAALQRFAAEWTDGRNPRAAMGV